MTAGASGPASWWERSLRTEASPAFAVRRHPGSDFRIVVNTFLTKPRRGSVSALAVGSAIREGMMVAASYFRQKALDCRQLAQALTDQKEPIVAKLLSMAEEFEANARAFETRITAEASRVSGLDMLLTVH